MSDLKQFLELFKPLPGNHYLQVTTSPDETTTALSELIQTVDGEFHLAVYDENELNIQDKFPHAMIQHIKNFKQPFRALPRTHDVVVFKDFFHLHHNQNGIIKIAYATLANTADIIIMQKKGTMDIEATKEFLTQMEFRSANEIDVHPEYDLVMAKKMHMWGNGL